MSRLHALLHKGPPPPPPPASAFALGVNMIDDAYYVNLEPTGDLIRPGSDHFRSDASGNNPVPRANRDSNGYPNSLPSGATKISIPLQNPVSTTQRTLSWTNNGGAPATITITSATINSSTATSITFTPTVTQPSSSAMWIEYTGITPSNYPTDFTCSTGAGVIGADMNSKLSALGGGGPIRYIKWLTTEAQDASAYLPDPFGSGVGSIATVKYPQDGDGQLKVDIITSANRNKTLNDPGFADGMRLESLAAFITATNRDAWWNCPVLVDSTYRAAAGTILKDAVVASGKTLISAFGNELWNGGTYWLAHMIANEADYRGTQPGAKTAVRVVATSNITLSGLQTIDGVTLVAGDRVLVAGQSTASQNGVYVASSGAWTRATDADTTGEIAFRDVWFVTAGTTYANKSFFCWTEGTITIGTTAIAIRQLTGYHRYAEKSEELADAMITAFAGMRSQLKNVLEWQNAGSSGAWDEMARWLGTAGMAKFDAFATAPYIGDNGTTGDSTSRTGSIDPVITLTYTNIGLIVDTLLAAHKTKAASYGKPLWLYECGTHWLYSDVTLRQNLQTSSQTYDLMREYFNRLTTVLGTSAKGCYFSLAFPIDAGSTGSFGLLIYISQAGDLANAPKYKALVDYLAA